MAEGKVDLTHDWAGEHWDWPTEHHSGVVKVHHDKDKFEVHLHCSYFTPNEIHVKVVGHDLIVDCVHDERSDSHGKITRSIHRTYHLPADVNPGDVKSHLDKRGVLIITAPIKK